jgi:hypothetical protein
MHPTHSNLFTRPGPYLSIAVIAAVVALGVPLKAPASIASTAAAAPSTALIRLGSILTQDLNSDEDHGVSSDEIEKYVAVYREMHRDRSLSVEGAAAKEGLSINQFRRLEQKIERNEVAREHVRTELQAAASASPSAESTAVPSKN